MCFSFSCFLPYLVSNEIQVIVLKEILINFSNVRHVYGWIHLHRPKLDCLVDIRVALGLGFPSQIYAITEYYLLTIVSLKTLGFLIIN
ncbi:hypothetical protein L2E82_15954 [Cichorium intybus]|uniref:Uncharacterized protein n=1 Tax=Cichorium intybus TaxID=13427 RepID=A0ACB9F3I9_CICIN|nr:hypothetical protein L2E82_15954 [Cichorium intybus]